MRSDEVLQVAQSTLSTVFEATLMLVAVYQNNLESITRNASGRMFGDSPKRTRFQKMEEHIYSVVNVSWTRL